MLVEEKTQQARYVKSMYYCTCAHADIKAAKNLTFQIHFNSVGHSTTSLYILFNIDQILQYQFSNK